MGREMLCGVGRLGGLYAGFVINRQGLVGDPDAPDSKRPAGILYRDGIAKISAFSRACNSDGIPLIWLQDISGFDIGQEAERHGLLAFGSNLIYTNSTNDVPMFTVLLRKASGAGYYAMSGLPFDPVVQLSTCLSRQSVMEGRTLAIAAHNTKLDDDFEIVTKDPEERARIAASMDAMEARIEADMDPFVAARQMDTDEIVELGALRDWLAALVEMSYQSPGYRRLKKPPHLDPPRPRSPHGGRPMSSDTICAGASLSADGRVVLSAPTVGLWRHPPPLASRVTPGSPLGSIEVLGRRVALVAPADAEGWVEEVALGERAFLPVQFAETLIILAEAGGELVSARPRAVAQRAASSTSARVFASPTSGRFYGRPGPDQRPFLTPGETVEPGQTVCILEIMKTFNRIPYAGERARVVAIVPKDGADIEAGSPLLELGDLEESGREVE